MDVTLQLPDRLDRNAMALAFQHMLNALAAYNADWVMEQWAKLPKEKWPQCCAKCNGCKYRPPTKLTPALEFASTPVLFARRWGACGEIAACHTGHKIAEAVRSGMSWEKACQSYTVIFDDAKNPNGDFYFHAICNDNGKILDPTIGMPR